MSKLFATYSNTIIFSPEKWAITFDDPIQAIPKVLTPCPYFSQFCHISLDWKLFTLKLLATYSNTNIFSPEKWAFTFNDLFQTFPQVSSLSPYFSQFCPISLAWKVFTLENSSTYSNTILFLSEKWAIVLDEPIQVIPQVSDLSPYFSQFCHLSLDWKLFTLKLLATYSITIIL